LDLCGHISSVKLSIEGPWKIGKSTEMPPSNKARMFLKRNKNIIELLDTELILEYKMMIDQNKVLATQYKKIMNLESKIRTKKIEESREAKLRSFGAGQRAKKFNSATTDAKAKLKPTPRRLVSATMMFLLMYLRLLQRNKGSS